MNEFKTKTGLILPLMSLKGKPYLQVVHRVAWFRSEKPEWTIKTELITTNDKMTIAKAEIINESGRTICDAFKQETAIDFKDHLEKACTGAVGRALALCGYGTQFAEIDFDEMPRIVDSPVTPAKAPKPDYAAMKVAIQQKEPAVFAPNPMLRLQEAAKIYAWTGEQMRIFMQSRFGKLLVKELTEKEIALLCEIMSSQSHAAAMEELKDNIK